MEMSGTGQPACTIAENYKPQLRSIMVQWINTWKVNTDGGFMEAKRVVGAGGIVRNSNGEMVMPFASPIQ